jgi:hypothetical protein
MNIDGVRVKIEHTPKQKAPTKRIPARVKRAPKHIKLLNSVDHKQLVTIVATFLVTFVFSIATSQGLASINHQPREQAELIDAPLLYANDFGVTTQPSMLSLNDKVLSNPDEVYLPKENISVPDPLKKRQEFLEKYLGAKKSPLANHVAAISEQTQWKLIIAIARAESSFCKHQVTNNCWGIGGAWNMKNYKNYDEAVADVNRILERYYIQAGLKTPKQIVKKYVGHENANWESAVAQELENLSKVE